MLSFLWMVVLHLLADATEGDEFSEFFLLSYDNREDGDCL